MKGLVSNINEPYRTNRFQSQVAVDYGGLNGIVDDILVPKGYNAFFDTPEKWISNIILFNCELYDENKAGNLDFGYSRSKTKAYRVMELNRSRLFNMGKYPIKITQSFLNHSPYSKLEVWLPYYGLVDLNLNEIFSKYERNLSNQTIYIYFRLQLDLYTGKGVYYIYTSFSDIPNFTPSPTQPRLFKHLALNDTNYDLYLIGYYECQVGIILPLGTSNASDSIRNMIMSGVQATTSIAGAVVTGTTNANKFSSTMTTSSTKETVYRKRNEATGRKVQALTATENIQKTRTTDGARAKREEVGDRMNSALNSSMSALANLSISGSAGSIANADTYGQMSFKIIVRYKTARVNGDLGFNVAPFNNDRITEFKEIYGLPYGRYVGLSILKGFATISDIQIPCFNQSITSEEITLIETALKNGVIF